MKTLYLLVALNVRAWAGPGLPPVPITNDRLTELTDINHIFMGLELDGAQDNKRNLWKDILNYNKINPCEPNQTGTPRINAEDSGILNDAGNSGNRSVHFTSWPSKHGSVLINFTYDWIKESSGKTKCGFEVFIRAPGKKIVGMVLDGTGKVLKTAPPELVHDKSSNNAIISSGAGCFKCHPRVSYKLDEERATHFWGPKNAPAHKSDAAKIHRDQQD